MAAAKRGHSSTEDVQPREIYIFVPVDPPHFLLSNRSEIRN